MAFGDKQFRIYGKDKKMVGTVSAKSEGHARIRAVEDGLVPGKKQITKVEELPLDDFYEQTWEDIYG